MKLTLTEDDGTVIEQWNIEEEFGDLRKAMPRAFMAETIAGAAVRPIPFTCPLCGQRITDGKPCGCGAR